MDNKPKYTYNLAVYKIRDIKIKDFELKGQFSPLESGKSYVGLEITKNVGNSHNICNVIACGDSFEERPNFMFHLPDSIQPEAIDYNIDRINHENAHEYDDLDEEDYTLLAKLQDESFKYKVMDHFIQTDLTQRYGGLSDSHIKSKEFIENLKKQIQDNTSQSEVGIEVDNERLSAKQIIEKLDYINLTNKEAFSSIINLIASLSK